MADTPDPDLDWWQQRDAQVAAAGTPEFDVQGPPPFGYKSWQDFIDAMAYEGLDQESPSQLEITLDDC